jgi:excinuclease ABC subunit B
LQQAYNEANHIVPQSIIKPIDMSLVAVAEGDYVTVPLEPEGEIESIPPEKLEDYIRELEERMREAARKFDFKQAAAFRDRVRELRNRTVVTAAPT